MTKSFTVELERAGKTSARFPVPFDLKGAFGQARPPVRVTMKRPETRTKRIAETVRRVRAGEAPP